MAEIDQFKGKTFKKIHGKVGAGELIFTATDGDSFRMYHSQNCCEDVYLEDVAGDLADLVGSEILHAEEAIGPAPDGHSPSESETWTFYKLSTIKGSVTLRWYGSSNGYYSEDVSIYKIVAK